MQLSYIRPGDTLEYVVHTSPTKSKRKTGKVVQVTTRMISLQGERYPDDILVTDLLSGATKIAKLTIGEENPVIAMVKGTPREDKAELRAKAKELIAGGASAAAAARAVGVPATTLDGWLRKEKQQTSAPEPAQVANQEPVQMPQETAEPSVSQREF